MRARHMSESDEDDLVNALREELDTQRAQMLALEATADEYRRQMDHVLASASWRVTAPLRGVAGRVRMLRRRARRVAGRPTTLIRQSSVSSPTAGLFRPRSDHAARDELPRL